MNPRTGRLSYRSPSESRSSQHASQARERGYALLLLMMMVTLLLVSLSVALPSIYVEGQREREEELIFRGNEYARAIAFFHRRFNRFPNSVDELLKTNGIRFLRHPYADPMSRSGKWRFIRAGINGALLNSQLQPVPGQTATGNPQNPSSDSGAQSASTAPQEERPGSSSDSGGGKESASFFNTSGRTSPFSGRSGDIQGAFIAGVASSSTKESIRILNHHKHYDEWEFLGVEGAGALQAASEQPATPTQPGKASSSDQPTMSGQPKGPRIPVSPPLTDQPLPQQ